MKTTPVTEITKRGTAATFDESGTGDTFEIATASGPGALEMTPEDAEAAAQIGLVLSDRVEDSLARLSMNVNQVARIWVETGYLLLHVKAQCKHGEFQKHLNAAGLPRRKAADMMQAARFVTSLPPENRLAFVALPKQKLTVMARAEPDALEYLLENGADDLELIGYRELKRRLDEARTIMATEAEKLKYALLAAEKAERKLRGLDERPDGLPHVLAAVREEVMAHAGAAGEGVQALGEEVRALMRLDIGDASPTLVLDSYRLALGHLAMLAMQVNGLIGELAQMLPEGERVMTPEAVLSTEELDAVATRMQQEQVFRSAQKAHRTDQRKRDAQKGPGRRRNVAPEPKR